MRKSEVVIVQGAKRARIEAGFTLAVQLVDENRVILHDVERSGLPKISELIGKDILIRSVDGRVAAIAEEIERPERNRRWNR